MPLSFSSPRQLVQTQLLHVHPLAQSRNEGKYYSSFSTSNVTDKIERGHEGCYCMGHAETFGINRYASSDLG